MLIKEYRIPLPLTVEEYQIGQLYCVAEASKMETGDGEGVEIIANEPFDNFPLVGDKYSSGQFTHKIYHLNRKVPSVVKLILPKGALELHEKAWNAYPFCRTVLSNPTYMKDNFSSIFDSLHVPDNGNSLNPLDLPEDVLKKREVVYIDIANDPILPGDYVMDFDPTKFHSKKTNRGPFLGDWITRHKPVMTCYKYLAVEFKWFGFQGRIESLMHRTSRRVMTLFHRQVVCTMDQWMGLTLNDIRKLEDETKLELDKQRKFGAFRGTCDLSNG